MGGAGRCLPACTVPLLQVPGEPDATANSPASRSLRYLNTPTASSLPTVFLHCLFLEVHLPKLQPRFTLQCTSIRINYVVASNFLDSQSQTNKQPTEYVCAFNSASHPHPTLLQPPSSSDPANFVTVLFPSPSRFNTT